jgi:HEAT repeat protein
MALGQSGDSHAVKPLIESLKDRDPYIRAFAGMALIRIGAPAVQPLIAAMKDNDLYVSALSAMALSSIKDPRAHDALMRALQEHNSRAIFGSHTFFVKLGVPGSESALIEALNKFPSQEMAEEFLNSGNPALVSSANDWARKYKHSLKPAPATASVHWGSGQDTALQSASNHPLSAQ